MKKILLSVALAGAAFAANAQLSFTDGTNMPVINGYNPGGGPNVAMGGKIDSTISTGAGGLLTATFLGYEALDTNTFSFNFGLGHPHEQDQPGRLVHLRPGCTRQPELHVPGPDHGHDRRQRRQRRDRQPLWAVRDSRQLRRKRRHGRIHALHRRRSPHLRPGLQ